MRVGYIGHFGAYHTEWGVADALEKYAQVDCYHFPNLDRQVYIARDYDLTLTTCPHMFGVEFWQSLGPKVAHYFDLIPGWKEREKLYFPALKLFELVLSTDANHPAYGEAGINARWLKQAYDPKDYYPVEAPVERDVGFVGHLYDRKRKRIAEVLSRRFTFEAFGSDGQCRGEEHARVCASSRIMVADNARNDLKGYWSNRAYLHLACGAFVLHPRVPGMSSYFKDKKHLVYYDGEDDLVAKVAYYLEHQGERGRIAEAGRKLVARNHTWKARVAELWRLLCESGLSPTRT